MDEKKTYCCNVCGKSHVAADLLHYVLDPVDTKAEADKGFEGFVLNCYENFDDRMIADLVANGTIVLCEDHLSVDEIQRSSGGILSPAMRYLSEI